MPPPELPTRRLSRAQWLVWGSSVALLACTEVMTVQPDAGVDASASDGDVDASANDGGGDALQRPDSAKLIDAGVEDARHEDAAKEAGHDAAPHCPQSGTFACGSEICDRATESCVYGFDGGECAKNATLHSFPKECLDCPTCECINTAPSHDYCISRCWDMPDGGIEVSCSCYGCPPARLERLKTSRRASRPRASAKRRRAA